jgi:uncharacterized protein YdeI (YjbR/CyaY-like superfamily)
MEQYDSRVDAYIERSAPFARPILTHLRQLVHSVSPLLNETMKWGFPFFDYHGSVCQMAAFKEHIGFGFWQQSKLNDIGKFIKAEDGTAGSFGKITSLNDLPPDEILVDFIKQAMLLNEPANKKPAVKKETAPKAPIEMPADFAGRLANNPKAQAAYEKFSPSGKREYLEWIADAKSDATRQKRLDTAIVWIAEGKSRHWKYKTPVLTPDP